MSTSTTPALVNDYLAPVLSDFLEPPVPVVQVVQVLQLQIIEQTVMTPATHCLVFILRYLSFDFGNGKLTEYLMTILIGTEREFVCDVKEKLCYVALGNGTELKSTEESSDKEAYRFQPSFVGMETGGPLTRLSRAPCGVRGTCDRDDSTQTVEVPQVQFFNKVVDALASMQMHISTV